MKRYFLILTVFFSVTLLPLKAANLKVMSFNIRYDNKGDAPYDWNGRKEAIKAFLTEEHPALLGIQEGLYHQVTDIDNILEGYARAGVGRDDGKQDGEFSAIYYDKTRFEATQSGNFWLSESPQEPTIGWDAACKRIVTWVELKEIKSGHKIYYFNTHFDHVGQTARLNSADLIFNKIKEIAGDNPAILSGDLNATREDKTISRLADSGVLFNTGDTAAKIVGGSYTYHDFGRTNGGIIDYIMISSHFKARENRIVPDKYNGIFLSDHNPVIAVIKIK